MKKKILFGISSLLGILIIASLYLLGFKYYKEYGTSILKIIDKKNLYTDNNLPKFELIKNNLDKQKTIKLQICNINIEEYIKILNQKLKNNKTEKIQKNNCIEKIIIDNNQINNSKINNNLIRKIKFDLSKEIGNPAKNGFYYIDFINKNKKIQEPITFGIINSHLTMKISKNGKGFIFVNDFEGNTLENQEIELYTEDLEKSKIKKTLLGKTNSNGILEINLSGKLDNKFYITSKSKKYYSYLDSELNKSEKNLNKNSEENSIKKNIKYKTHIFTDKKIYYQDEEVNIKAIIREVIELKIPKNKELNIIINSNNKEFYNKKIKLSQYGSIYEKIKLNKKFVEGKYIIFLKDNDGEYGKTNFSVINNYSPNEYMGEEKTENNNKLINLKTEKTIDKTDNKAFIEIKNDKKIYKPREKIVLNISNKDKNQIGKKAELTIIVIDNNLIKLNGNIDLNILEAFHKNKTFIIDNIFTNIKINKNNKPIKQSDNKIKLQEKYYKTAYYNPSIITDDNGNAKVEFQLPNNLNKYKIIVLSNSIDNYFGYTTKNIEVKKNITIEDKSPLIYRYGDKIEIGTKITNNTNERIGFTIKFNSKDIEVENPIRKVFINKNSNKLLHFWINKPLNSKKDIKYTIYALGNNIENSDKIERTLEYKEFPIINKVISKGGLAEKGKKQHFKIKIPKNTDLKKSKVKISFTNNPLNGLKVEKHNLTKEEFNKIINKKDFIENKLIINTYGLINNKKIKNKEIIENSIKEIIKILENNKSSKVNDKIIFISILIDYGYDKKTIDKYIQELYGVNWSNYYYSKDIKNIIFDIFNKYSKKYGDNSSTNFAFSIGYIQNRDKRFYLGANKANTITREFILDDVVQYKENFIELTTYIISGKSIFTKLTLHAVPKDKLKIKETANNIKVSRKIFKTSDNTEVEDGIFKKGELYKIKININFNTEKDRRNLALEDYIPSTFKIIKIENNNGKDIKILKDKILVNFSNTFGKNISFEYTVKPEFRGEYTYPPVNTYMMYDGEVNAHSSYNKIKVK